MPLELHRAKLDVGPEQSVASIAYDSCYGRVAIARERGTVEIREGEGLWRLCAIIPGDDNASTTSVEWIRSASGEHPLLVTAGLEGTLATWDIRSGSPADIVDSYGGAIWAIVGEKNPRNAQRLAVACDDGAVRQYEVSGSGGLVLRRVMPRATCRQLSVDWLEAPSRVVAGGSDSCVRIYDADSAQEALRVTLGGESVCAWAVAAVTDRLFAVGDSEGRLSVYDSHQGTLEHRERRHAADVLAVAAVQSTTGKGGKRIFSGGADGMIAVYDATESEQPGLIEGAPAVRQDRWAYSACKRPHSHDVYALCCALQSDAVFSGGLDGSVMACSASGYLEFHPWDVIRQGDPTMFSSSILDQDRALLSCPWGRRVHLYRAGKAGDPVAKDGKRDGARLNISEPVGHEASIRLPTRAHARCAALSPGGQLVAASDRHGTRVVELKSRRVAMRSPPARNVALCGASDAFLVAVDANDDSLRVTSIRRGQESALLSEHVRRATSDAVSTAANRNPSQMPLVRELACSADGRYAAVSMQSGPIAVFVYDLRKLELHWAFPCPTTNKGDAYAAISTLTFTLDGAWFRCNSSLFSSSLFTYLSLCLSLPRVRTSFTLWCHCWQA